MPPEQRCAPAGTPPPPPQPSGAEVLVDLDVLIAERDESAVAEAVRVSVASAAGTAVLGSARWGETAGGEDLVRQWSIEQRGAPLEGRRLRRLSMSVHAEGITDLLDEIVWAAIDAICPAAREENRRLDAGESPVPASPAQYPWASRTRAADAGHDQ